MVLLFSVGQRQIALISLVGIPFSLVVKFLGLFGKGKFERRVAVFAHEECLKVALGLFGIKSEGIPACFLQIWIVAIQVPVADYSDRKSVV